MFDFSVKSSVHNYEVKFVSDVNSILKDEINNNDAIIIDSNVKNNYPDLLKNIKTNHILIVIEANEIQKSYDKLIPIIKQLIINGFKRNHKLIGIGGGITQDITAFIASIMYRGVKWIFFPTTLLAQGDSCIGSKTSINFDKYKNQIGGFYPANKIFINIDFLDTLSNSDIQSGMGEMSHYFVIAGKEEFNNYKNNYPNIINNKKDMARTIARSLQIKKQYIEIDEFDRNERQIFNYGHSFGHAIESLTNYKIPHGIAVSLGMDIANFVSVKKNILPMNVRNEIRELLIQIWNGYDISNINIDDFLDALSKDKKNVGKELRLILCKGYGKVFKEAQELNAQFKSWLSEYFSNELV